MRTLWLIILLAVSSSVGAAMNLRDATYAAILFSGATSAPPAAFIPTNVGAPLYWWVADSITDPGKMTNWPNSFGGKDLTYISGENTFISNSFLNGHKIVALDGTQGGCQNLTITNLQPLEIWMVVSRMRAAAAFQYIFSDGATGFYYRYDDSGTQEYAFAASYVVTSPWTPEATNGVWHTLTCVFDGSNSRVLTNDVVRKTANSGTNWMKQICFGTRPDGGVSWSKISLSEIIIYGATNTPTDRASIQTYLKDKYGL